VRSTRASKLFIFFGSMLSADSMLGRQLAAPAAAPLSPSRGMGGRRAIGGCLMHHGCPGAFSPSTTSRPSK